MGSMRKIHEIRDKVSDGELDAKDAFWEVLDFSLRNHSKMTMVWVEIADDGDCRKFVSGGYRFLHKSVWYLG